MRARQFISEAFIDRDLVSLLISKGYQPLGKKGADQQAFLEPDTNMVLKVFGTDRSTKDYSMKLTPGQQTFKIFYDYCLANQDNPFLPQCLEWERFEWEGQMYLQIRMERLFEFTGHAGWAVGLENIAAVARFGKEQYKKNRFIDDHVRSRNADPYDEEEGADTDQIDDSLFLHLGDKFNLLWDTIYDLAYLARSNDIKLDLHRKNFMLGSDGEIVISDPFWCGTW